MERAPKLVLGTACGGKDRRQVQEDGSVGQVAAAHEVFDHIGGSRGAGRGCRSGRRWRRAAGRETSSEHELAETVRQPFGIALMLSYARSQPLTAVAIRSRVLLGLEQERRGLRIDQEPEDSGQGALGRPLLAVGRQDRIGTTGRSAAVIQATRRRKSSLARLNVRPQQVDRTVPAGQGSGSSPAGRRK